MRAGGSVASHITSAGQWGGRPLPSDPVDTSPCKGLYNAKDNDHERRMEERERIT